MSAPGLPPLPEPPARSPFDTRSQKPPVEKPQADQPGPQETEAEAPRPKSKTSQSAKRPEGTTDFLVSLPDELSDRMEDVIGWTYPHTGINTKSAFIRTVIARACAEYEDRYNDGQRFPAVPRQRKGRRKG